MTTIQYRRLTATWFPEPSALRASYMFAVEQLSSQTAAIFIVYNDVRMIAIYPDIIQNQDVGEKADTYGVVETIAYTLTSNSGYDVLLASLRTGDNFFYATRLAQQLETLVGGSIVASIPGGVDVTGNVVATIPDGVSATITGPVTISSDTPLEVTPSTGSVFDVQPANNSPFTVAPQVGTLWPVAPGTTQVWPVASPGMASVVVPATGVIFPVTSPGQDHVVIAPYATAVFPVSAPPSSPLAVNINGFIDYPLTTPVVRNIQFVVDANTDVRYPVFGSADYGDFFSRFDSTVSSIRYLTPTPVMRANFGSFTGYVPITGSILSGSVSNLVVNTSGYLQGPLNPLLTSPIPTGLAGAYQDYAMSSATFHNNVIRDIGTGEIAPEFGARIEFRSDLRDQKEPVLFRRSSATSDSDIEKIGSTPPDKRGQQSKEKSKDGWSLWRS